MIKKLFLLFLVFSISISAQERKPLYGKVLDSITTVKNVHVLNLQTNKATFTDFKGNFKIFAKIGDSLKITSIQYETKIYRVTKISFDFNDVQILLKKKIYILDEVELKNTELSGYLEVDIDKISKDRHAESLEKLMDLSKVDMKIVEADDYIDKRIRPQIVRTDPNLAFVGAGVSAGIPFGYSKRLWALRSKLAFKKSFPVKILNELGKQFFFEKLKIPVEEYYRFLDYCSYKNIETLFKNNQILQLIHILQEESINFLQVLKEQK